MGVSLVILAIKVKIKRFDPIDTVKILAQTFLYVFTVSSWVGLVGMFCADAYEELKKNGNRNLNKVKLCL